MLDIKAFAVSKTTVAATCAVCRWLREIIRHLLKTVGKKWKRHIKKSNRSRRQNHYKTVNH